MTITAAAKWLRGLMRKSDPKPRFYRDEQGNYRGLVRKTFIAPLPTLLMLEDGKAYLRDGEQPGSAELVFFTEDGRSKAHPLSPVTVRRWAAKLTEIAARVG